jgi:hypothetical protein
MTPSDRVALLVLLTVSLLPAALRAQSGDNAAAARALFSEARTLAAAGKYADACPKFEESLRLNRGIGTQFNLADCLERTGRTASAWGHFLEVAAGARAAGQAERETVARDRAAALEPKLARLVIQVDDPLPGLEVRRDGVVVGAASYRTATPVDPGKHVVEATAPGRQRWTDEVVVPAAPGVVTVRVPELVPEAGAPAAAVPSPSATGGAGASAPPPAAMDQTSSSSSQRTLALVAGGVGVAGLAVGTGFFFKYRSDNGKAEDVCRVGGRSPCPSGSAAKHQELVSSARVARTFTYVGWGVGAAGLAGAAVLWFTAPSHDDPARDAAFRAEPLLLPAGLGAAVSGTF